MLDDFGGIFTGEEEVYLGGPAGNRDENDDEEDPAKSTAAAVSGSAIGGSGSGTISIAPGPLPFFQDYEIALESALSLANGEEDTTKGDKKDDDEDEGDGMFMKMYQGGIYLSAPMVILAGEESDVMIAWSMPPSEPGLASGKAQGPGLGPKRTVYIAHVSFTSMHQAASREGRKRRGASFIDQPAVTHYSVQTLHKRI